MLMSYRYAVQNYDQWLQRSVGTAISPPATALDIGCGPGLDTQFLTARGFEVRACDISLEAVEQSKKLNPTVPHELANARDLGIYADGAFDLVVAGLSLHYFNREDSHRAFDEVHRILRPGGLFLFRLNAWDDYEFGAPPVFQEWRGVEAPGGGGKQFFSEGMIRELVTGRFEQLSIEKKRGDRYAKPKSFFECGANKSGSPPHAEFGGVAT